MTDTQTDQGRTAKLVEPATKRFTAAMRQEIIKDFASRNGGMYDAKAFFAEVERTGPTHPAYQWFEWDEQTAAREHNIEQARQFARGLRIVFEVTEYGRSGTMKIRTEEAPFAISPMAGRQAGGGYWLLDPNDPVHMREHCEQAARTLRSWLDRYRSAITYCGAKETPVERMIEALEEANRAESGAA